MICFACQYDQNYFMQGMQPTFLGQDSILNGIDIAESFYMTS
jgi:hypothetical protein